jgi:hypothetical protein
MLNVLHCDGKLLLLSGTRIADRCLRVAAQKSGEPATPSSQDMQGL